jgi:hypothetical protein
MAAQDYEQAFAGAPNGGMVGSSATEKVGFWGVTPVVQPAGADQAALTLTTTTSSSPVGLVTASGFVALFALVEEIRASLVDCGIMKGGA